MSKRDFCNAFAAMALLGLTACGADGTFNPDLRGLTSGSSAAAPQRPAPDSRGVITFENSQIVVATAGETPAVIASRLGIPAAQLANYNALPADTVLSAGAVLVLPQRVASNAPAASTGGGVVRDPFASQTSQAAKPAASTPTAAPSNPREHIVAAGETPWGIARRYGVTVQDLASWNGLPADMSLRPGQRLIVPQPGSKPDQLATTPPGSGSPTPTPPSAAAPLPSEDTTAAASATPQVPETNLGATRTAASSGGQFRMPVNGSIIRVYEKGKNDGIDIAAPQGASIAAASAGEVAAVTKDSAGRPIIVVRHSGNLMSVYTNLSDVAVTKGDTVSAGQTLGKADSSGSVHFEIRRGFESLDPEQYIN